MPEQPKFEKPKLTTDQLKALAELVTKKETAEGFLSFEDFQDWLKAKHLEEKLEGGSLEALIEKQEKYYQSFYGPDFKIDPSQILIGKERLAAIQQGLEIGAVNYPLIMATPQELTADQQNQTEAQFAYHALLKPLKPKGLKIWAETGQERWSKLSLEQVLAGYQPVQVEDFNPQALEQDWIQEIQRVLKQKPGAPKQKPGKLELVLTDSRSEVPPDQKLVNQKGQVVVNQYSFIKMIQNQVQVLTPEQWLILASQKYHQDQTYLSPQTWDWLMAILDHRGQLNEPPVSAADADSNDVEVHLNSNQASSDLDGGRWRLAL